VSNQAFIPLVQEGTRVPDCFVDAKTGVIYFIKSVDGKKVKFSTKETIWTTKTKAFVNKTLKIKLGKQKLRITPLIKDELPLYLAVKLSEGLKPLTEKNIKNAVKRIEPFWADRFPHEINRDNLAEWYQWLDKTYPGEQKENPVKYMRNFCYYLAEKVHNGFPLLPAVPKISDPDRKRIKAERIEKKGRIFLKEEFTKLYRAGDEQEKLIALFMYTMASRVNETLSLRFGKQILLNQETPVYRWTLGQNKADHIGEHALPTALIAPLRALESKRKKEGTDLLFPQRGNNKRPLRAQMVDWKSWSKRAGLDWHWTSHTFRHTCLSNLFNDEKNPQALICKLYRTSLAVALAVYIKPTKSGIEKLRNAIEVEL
jgi:integrase